MKQLTDLEAAVQVASDRVADALLAGDDTTTARRALNEARAALQAHQDAQRAAESERRAAESEREAAEVAASEADATARALQAVDDTVQRVQMPAGVVLPAPVEHQMVAKAAAEVARLKVEIQRSEPERKKVADEIASFTSRANAKRAEASAIRSRRLIGREEAGDAAALHLLEADANDLAGLAQAAQMRLQALGRPVAGLRQQLAAAEEKLKAAQVEAALHGQADRVRTLEAALIAGVRELRGSVLNAGFSNLPSFFAPTQKLRDVANGIAV